MLQCASVRKTSSALKLRTDASMRFEKSQDPANTVRGLARAVELLQEVSPGIRLVGGLADRSKVSSPPTADPATDRVAGAQTGERGERGRPCATSWSGWSSAFPTLGRECSR